MKRKAFYKIFTILVTASILIAACTKEPSDVKLDPKLSTSQVINIKSDSATVVGFIVAAGSGFSEKGICYDIATGPTTASNKVIYDGVSKLATFNVKVGGLTHATNYYARAYAINSSGTIYGDEITFKTMSVIPTLANITTPVFTSTPDKGINLATSVNITDDGGPDPTAEITKRGVVYALFAHPTVDSTKSKFDANRTIATSEGTGIGAFTSHAVNLSGVVKYYLRAYATNKIGTAYSNEISFTTPVSYPTVTTTAATNVAGSTATSGGVVTNDGGGTITARGVCWSTSEKPTTADSKTSDGTGKGTFISSITGLSLATTYHVRAYAVNSTGTGYGADLQFSTYPDSMYIVGAATAYNWDTPGTHTAAAMHVVAGGDSFQGIYWKICFLTGGQGFKLSNKNWGSVNLGFSDVTSYDADGVAVTSNGGNMQVAADGMYVVVLNLQNSEKHVSIKPAEVYAIGDAFGGYTTGVAANKFTVNNTAKTLVSPAATAAGNLRSYVSHPWLGDWWHAEFILSGTDIIYRNAGGDPAAVPLTIGQKVTYHFDDNTGSIGTK